VRVFDRIYRANGWNGVESRSGPGSGPVPTANVAAAILDLVAELGVTSVLDVGCGDGAWLPDLPGYTGIDVAPTAIRLARADHSYRRYFVGDIREAGPWQGRYDLVFCRDMLQHIPIEDVVAVLEAIRATGSTWLLASTYRDGRNRVIRPGGYHEPDLEREPYSLGPPDLFIFDGYDYEHPDLVRDARKHLGLWRLA
jgi:SAM-dependent methyltransferase